MTQRSFGTRRAASPRLVRWTGPSWQVFILRMGIPITPG